MAQANSSRSGSTADNFGDVITEMTRRLVEANRHYGEVTAAIPTHQLGREIQRERELGEQTTSSMRRLIDSGQIKKEEPKDFPPENPANEMQELAETVIGALLSPLTKLLTPEAKPEEDTASNHLRAQQERYQMIFNMAKPK